MRYFEILSLFSVLLMILMAAGETSGSGKLARFIHIIINNIAKMNVEMINNGLS